MQVEFSPFDVVATDYILPRSAIVELSDEEPLDLFDIRSDVFGLRFKLDEDAYNEARVLLGVPQELHYRMMLVEKNDELYGKRGTFRNDTQSNTTDWNLFIPVSDRFEFTDDSIKFVNRTLYALLRVTAHAHMIRQQYGGKDDLTMLAFQATFDIINHDAYILSKEVVDSGTVAMVPSDSPAEIEMPLSEGAEHGAEERTDETDQGD